MKSTGRLDAMHPYPEQSAHVAGLIVRGRRELDLAIPSRPYRFRMIAVAECRKSGKRNVVPLSRQLARPQDAVLADGTVVGRQPVADIENPAAVANTVHETEL
jgi:hypothetical protein